MSKREPISRVIDRPIHAARAAHAARIGRRDTRFREPRTGVAGQRQLPKLCGPRPALCGVERGCGAGVFGRAEAMVLSHRRLRRLPRLFRRGRARRFADKLAQARVRRRGRRRGGLLHAGTLRRSHVEHHDGLERCGTGADHFSRADASAAVRPQRCFVQRGAGDDGRGGGGAALAARTRPRAGSGETSARARALSQGDRAA